MASWPAAEAQVAVLEQLVAEAYGLRGWRLPVSGIGPNLGPARRVERLRLFLERAYDDDRETLRPA